MTGIFAWVWLSALVQESGLECLEPEDSTGTSKAVMVKDRALAFTPQIFPLDEKGELLGRGDETRQIDYVLGRLSENLREAGSDLDQAVRIHVYTLRPETVDGVKKALARRFKGRIKPAATFISGLLPVPDALVGMDAVAAAPKTRVDRKDASRAAILPTGPVVFISGQAGNGEIEQAARTTLESLDRTLAHLGLSWSDVAQVKVFLQSIAAWEPVKQEIRKICGPASVPPLAFVEWRLETPVEIELVAQGRGGSGEARDRIRFVTPPGMKASPVYSLVTIVEGGRLIFTSGLYGSGDPEAQVREIFGSLRDLLEKAGSDLGHMAKATYFITDDLASRKLTEVRKELYDPARPPAASKAMVRGVGASGKAVMIDMIAVSRLQKP